MTPILAAHEVTKSFGATPALRGATIDIAPGEIVAVIGPSGSGKSTLLHCLAGIFPPDSGTITFDGTRLDQLTDAARTKLRRTLFGFVFQFGQLVPELTAIDNIALPLLLDGVPRRSAYARAGAWFPRLELDGLERRRTGELSGGQAQRVAVGRALATSAEGAVRRRADRLARLAHRREGDGSDGRHRACRGQCGGAGDP